MKKNYLMIVFTTLAISLLLFLLSLGVNEGALVRYSGDTLSFSYPTTWSFFVEATEYPNPYLVSSSSPRPWRPYIDDEALIKFNYPMGWIVNQESFVGAEILKHVRLAAPNKNNICIVEIWKAGKPLESFINDIRVANIRGKEAESFKVQKQIVNNRQGYLVSYKINNILCKEFYFTEENRVYRVAYFYSGPRWTKEQESNFQAILQSLEVL